MKTKNVEQNGFTIPPWRVRPLTAAPIPCSRTPQATLRPECSGVNHSSPSNSVKVEWIRSAAPPTIVGTNGPKPCMTWLADLRVASEAPGSKTGSAVCEAGLRLAGPGVLPLGGELVVLARPLLEAGLPLALEHLAALLRRLAPVRVHLGRDEEERVRIPAERLLRLAHHLVGHRVGVRVAGAGARRAVADHGLQADQRRPLLLGHALADRGLDRLEVVAVGDLERVPAVGAEALGHVLLVEREARRAVDRDAVVVVDVDELAEPQVAGERGGLGGDAFHQVAVGADREDVVVADLGAELLAQELLGHRHPDAVAEALAERAGGRLDARRVAVLRVARGLRAELAELLDLVEAQVVAREMQARVEEHRGVACGEHEAVPVRPQRVGGVVLHDLRVEEVRGRRERERGARMARLRSLHGIDRRGCGSC